jgi:hypothetical protein
MHCVYSVCTDAGGCRLIEVIGDPDTRLKTAGGADILVCLSHLPLPTHNRQQPLGRKSQVRQPPKRCGVGQIDLKTPLGTILDR